MFKRFLATTALALLPLAAGATTLIIPASGTGGGANNSRWETELFVHNATASVLTANVIFHDASGASTPQTLTVQPRATVNTSDVVHTLFGKTQATGALEITFDDSFAGRVAVTSRTINQGDKGTFGQDVPAVDAADAIATGSVSVLAVPSPSEFRLNAGVYAVSDTTVNWELLREDGTIAAANEISYTAGTQFQYNGAIATLFNQTAKDGDVIYANVTKGAAIAYASAIDDFTGDPTFVPGVRTKVDTHIAFGVDVNHDGVPDITDANGDGVLDQPVNLYNIGYPNYLRVIVLATGGDKAKIEMADNAGSDATIIDDQGTIACAPFGAGYRIDLKVKITVNGVSDIVTIPAVVK